MADAVELAIVLTAKDAASAVLGNVAGKFNALGAAGKLAVIGIAAASTAVVATVGTLTALATKSAAAATEVAKLKRETGLTAEAASKFRVIGERMGLDIDALSKSFGIFSKNVETNAKAIADNHVVVERAKDGHVDLERTLGTLAERFKNMPDGVEKTALALEIFGKSGKDMIPLLNQGKDGLKALGDEAERLGLVFDDKALAAAKRFTLAQKDLGENIEGLKNRLGMVFLPVLADVSAGLLSLATAILPTVSSWISNLTGFVRTAVGVFGDMKKAANFEMVGGGDFLGSLIGPAAAKTFMGLVRDISADWDAMWMLRIKPAIKWAEENIPPFWEKFKKAVSNMWDVIKPKLDAMVDKLEGLKNKFDNLPPSVQHWAEATAAGVVVVKATGLDTVVQGWANALGNFVSGGASATSVLVALGVGAATVVAGFLILTAAIGAVIYVGTHLDDLANSWTMLSLLIKLEVAKMADGVIGAWRAMLVWINKVIADATLTLNEWIIRLNQIPGINIPLITTIQIDLPNADNVSKVLDEIARSRTATITVYTVYEYTAPGGGPGAPPVFQHGGVMPYTGLAHLEKGERIIPASGVGSGSWGGAGPTINIYADVVDAQALDRFADRIGASQMRGARLAGGRV